MRTPFVAGNWKMFKDVASGRALAHEIAEGLRGISLADRRANDTAAGAVEVAVMPGFPLILAVSEALAETRVGVGAQNCHAEPEGAFTGEVSCEMLRSAGARYVILGHSERRRIFREDDGSINMKLRAALACELTPIFCVGETDEERTRGRTMAVVSQQLSLGLDGFVARELAPLVLAYEPVWAIGTGKNATPEQAEEVHAFIRAFLRDRFNEDLARAARIQYGGSVKPANAKAILSQENVDGALVGGASLEGPSFAAIVRAAAEVTKAEQR